MDTKYRKILFIDDEYTSIIDLIEYIEYKFSNIKCSTAQSLNTAREKIDAEKFDLIICDNMFVDDSENAGINFYEELIKKNIYIPFVLYTCSRIQMNKYPEFEKNKNFYYYTKWELNLDNWIELINRIFE